MELTQSSATDWLQPTEEREGLQRYVETIRERLWLIVMVVVITTGIALLYVATATKTYSAQAEMLVTPVSGTDPALAGLGLLTQSPDPTRDVETATKLIINTTVATRVKRALNLDRSPQDLLKSVTASPIAQSNIVALNAEDSSPKEAQRLANAFGRQTVAERTDSLHTQIDQLLPQLQAQAQRSGAATTGGTPLASQIAELQQLRASPDPTLRLQNPAPLPTSPTSPKPALSIIGGIVAGLILGIAAAFAAQVLDPRLRREAQLRRKFRLPILGRIPKEGRASEYPLAPRQISSATGEAYRALRATVAGSRRGHPGEGKVILVTGSSPAEGKTTTAINLATSLALAGNRVIVIESDLRRPVLGRVMGVQPENGGVVSVLIENTTLAESLTPSSTYGPNLRLLLSDYEGGWIAELFSIPTAERMIQDARRMADFVIVDSAPLNEVVDALPLALQADEVLVVTRLGITRLDKLTQLAELLAENGVRPVGFALIGTSRPRRNQYHYYAEPDSDSQDNQRQRQLLAAARRRI
jgi:tyrosine-protein kinase